MKDSRGWYRTWTVTGKEKPRKIHPAHPKPKTSSTKDKRPTVPKGVNESLIKFNGRRGQPSWESKIAVKGERKDALHKGGG